MSKIRRALLSVTDKTGIAAFAGALARRGVEIVSTGGTARVLASEGVQVRPLEELTGFPECLDGRVKTLHPKVHGGILNVRGNPNHRREVEELGIEDIDLVAVNLYAFEETSARSGVTLEEAIESIDIGGPSLVRGAAKNWRDVTIVTDPDDYERVIAEMDAHSSETSHELRFELACKAFAFTARYDAAIASYLESRPEAPKSLPKSFRVEYVRRQGLRYGENPHQEPAHFYVAKHNGKWVSLANARQLSGRELSYNNLLDLDCALALVQDFAEPAAVVIKHSNPCGAATAASLAEAYCLAYAGDPVSAFGSIVGLNRVVDEATAGEIALPDRFVEAVIAPGYDEDAREILRSRPKWGQNVRLLVAGPFDAAPPAGALAVRQVSGGLLVQPPDQGFPELDALEVKSARPPTADELADLKFAWIVGKHVRSNAIVYACGTAVVGVGAGQMSRVDSVRIAAHKAGARAAGAVMASDAFFPFRDGVDVAVQAGIKAVIQPGGSRRDEEVIAAADEHGIAMVFTGRRHFRH